MPTNERPLRDVLRLVDAAEDPYVLVYAERLARELRALAPLLREAARELALNLHPDDRVLVDRMAAKADELEAK